MTPEHLTMDQKFERLENRLVRILTLGLSSIGLVVVLIGLSMTYLLGAQKESIKDRSDIRKEVEEIKTDFGTSLLITPPADKLGYEWIYNELTQKYNTKRGTGDINSSKTK